jgi:hypothetical protein
MAYVSALPDRYSPVRSLDLCSNVFVDVPMPIAIGELPVLLVAGGVVPILWLSAPRSPSTKDRVFVVDEGQSVNPAIQVKLDQNKRETVITAGSTVILRAAMTTDDEAQVTELDLRPVGLNVMGTSSGLKIATNMFARNHIEGARIGIALG